MKLMILPRIKLLALLTVCIPAKCLPQAPSNPAPILEPHMPPQDAAARIDMALVHDYHLACENAAKYQRYFPTLPEITDDASFIRRACVDLAGRLPTSDEVRKFTVDQNLHKRIRLTDALTREAGAVQVRYHMLAEAFRVNDAEKELIAWLRQAAQDDRPYNEIVRHVIKSNRMVKRNDGDAMRTAVDLAHSVLGQDFHCAMCHDHPFSDHTQWETFQFAACFAPKNTVSLPLDYKYQGAAPGAIMPPYLPRLYGKGGGRWIDEAKETAPQIADWITHGEDSRRHVLVAALRVWKGLFGKPGTVEGMDTGSVEPAAPWHGVPPRHPGHYSRSCFGIPHLLRPAWLELELNSPSDFSQATKVLVEEFQHCGGRIGEFQRILARTNAYWRSSHAASREWADCFLAAAPQIRRLPADVLWTTLTNEEGPHLPEVPPQGHPLRLFGRGTREWSDESRAPVSHALVRYMMSQTGGCLSAFSGLPTEELFLHLVGREPQERESAMIVLQKASSEDVAWALLNTAEFMFVH